MVGLAVHFSVFKTFKHHIGQFSAPQMTLKTLGSIVGNCQLVLTASIVNSWIAPCIALLCCKKFILTMVLSTENKE